MENPYCSCKLTRVRPQTEAEQSDYKDPVSGVPLEKRSEESYFFRMVRPPHSMDCAPTRWP